LSKKYFGKVFVVDDGSKDKTALIAKAAGAIVITHKTNQGYGAALNSCFEIALKENAAALVIIDADGQHDPADSPRLLQALNAGADIVVGSRFSGKSHIPSHRRFGISLLTKLTNLGAGMAVSDSQSGFRAYAPKAIAALVGLKNNGMGASSEIIVRASEAGLKIAEVPIKVSYFGRSKRNFLLHGASVFKSIADLIMLKKPLVFFGFIGLAMLLIGILFGFYTIEIYNFRKALPFGPTILTVFFSLIGTLCIFSAVILDSVSRIVRNQ